MTLDESKKAQMMEFPTLEDFKAGQNNFYMTFDTNETMPDFYRITPVFQRFQKAQPELEQEVTTRITELRAEERPQFYYPDNFPEDAFEKLYEAYKLISQLVSIEDPEVMKDEKVDERYLVR